jgi:hypothetical protein
MIRPLVALVLAAALAGCGGGGDGDKTTSTSTPASTTSTVPRAKYTYPPTLATQRPVDSGNAVGVSLGLPDLPTGWVKTAVDMSQRPRSNHEDEVLVNCLFGEQPSPLTAYVVSPMFATADATLTMRSFVRVTESQANAVNDIKSFTAERIASCQDGMYDWENSLPEGVNSVVGRKYGVSPPVLMPVDPLVLPGADLKDVRGFRMVIAPLDTFTTRQDIFIYGAGRYQTVLVVQGSVVPDTNVESQVMRKLMPRTLTAAKLG